MIFLELCIVDRADSYSGKRREEDFKGLNF